MVGQISTQLLTGTAFAIDIAQPRRKTRGVTFALFKVGLLVLGICLLVMFLVPTPSGPFSAVYGPATAFHAVRTARRIFRAMAPSLKCATTTATAALPGFTALLHSMFTFTPEQNTPSDCSVLRC